MQYQKPSFSVFLGSEAFQEGHERIFGRKGVKAGEERTFLGRNGHRFDKGVGGDGYVDGTWKCIDCDLRVENSELDAVSACDKQPTAVENGGTAHLRLKTE